MNDIFPYMQPTKNLTMKNMVISLAKQSLSDDIFASREKFLKKIRERRHSVLYEFTILKDGN